jgi:hypothetical protein
VTAGWPTNKNLPANTMMAFLSMGHLEPRSVGLHVFTVPIGTCRRGGTLPVPPAVEGEQVSGGAASGSISSVQRDADCLQVPVSAGQTVALCGHISSCHSQLGHSAIRLHWSTLEVAHNRTVLSQRALFQSAPAAVPRDQCPERQGEEVYLRHQAGVCTIFSEVAVQTTVSKSRGLPL